MEWIVAAVPAVLVGGLLAVAGSMSYRLWRSAMRGEPLLMERILARKGLSLEGCADQGVRLHAGAAMRRCILCRERAACIAWLEGHTSRDVECFCPNAELMARIRAAQAE
jgi:hypothetical protein